MSKPATQLRVLFFLGLTLILAESCRAGMPALLPTPWTADSSPPTSGGNSLDVAAKLQAVSFFTVIFLGCAWLITQVFNGLRHDFPKLPLMTFRKSIGVLFLWSLAFVVVLTMISGARELMTPGAWQKQGWTYKLADTDLPVSSLNQRREQLEDLRTACWQFAALNNGQLPAKPNPSIDEELWNIRAWPGLSFLAVDGLVAESSGRLYIYEPDADGDERLVLLTNGFIGTMNTKEIRTAFAKVGQNAGGLNPPDSASSIGVTP